MSDIKLFRPTRARLAAVVAEAIAEANRGQKARLVNVSADAIVAEVLEDDRGMIQCDGGGVANSYKYAAYSSYLCVTWVRLPGGLAVRVESGRVRCGGSVTWQGPGYQTRRRISTGKPTPDLWRHVSGFTAPAGITPFDEGSELMYADMLQDNGFTAEAETIRKLFLKRVRKPAAV